MERLMIVLALIGILAAATVGGGLDLRDSLERKINEMQIAIEGRAAVVNDLSRQIDELKAPPSELPAPQP